MARVLPGAPRLAADCFGRQRLEGYGSRRLFDGRAPPRRARHGQQRRGYSGRTSERSHHVVLNSWSCNFRGAGRRKAGFAAVSIVFEASEAALRLLRWSYLSQWWLLASQSADDMAPIRVAGFGYTDHAMSRWTNSPN